MICCEAAIIRRPWNFCSTLSMFLITYGGGIRQCHQLPQKTNLDLRSQTILHPLLIPTPYNQPTKIPSPTVRSIIFDQSTEYGVCTNIAAVGEDRNARMTHVFPHWTADQSDASRLSLPSQIISDQSAASDMPVRFTQTMKLSCRPTGGPQPGPAQGLLIYSQSRHGADDGEQSSLFLQWQKSKGWKRLDGVQEDERGGYFLHGEG